MNLHAILAIYRFEMARTWRTVLQSIVSPVISTSLYFVVFGSAIGSGFRRLLVSFPCLNVMTDLVIRQAVQTGY